MLRTLFLSLFCLVGLHSAVGAKTIDQLSLEEKVGQLFIVNFIGETVTEDIKKLVLDYNVGGVVYYDLTNGLRDFSHVKKLSGDLQAVARRNYKIPLLISVDQEGGKRGTRLREGFRQSPGNGALGEAGKPIDAYKWGYITGQELRYVGIHLNFAPVVDVNSNPDNPVIGARAFGDDPELVATFGEHAVRGYLEGGVIPCIKHFPGHGDVAVDPHYALPAVDKILEDLHACELVPFVRLAPQAPAMMVAFVRYPALDPDRCAAFSKKIVQDLLRGEMGYEGVVITDSLSMGAVIDECGSEKEAAVQALEAGCDLLLMGRRSLGGDDSENLTETTIEMIQAVLEAVREGRLTEERINTSVKRILALKERVGACA